VNPYEDIIDKVTDLLVFLRNNDFSFDFVENKGYEYTLQLLREDEVLATKNGKRVDTKLSDKMALAIKILDCAGNRSSDRMLKGDDKPSKDRELIDFSFS